MSWGNSCRGLREWTTHWGQPQFFEDRSCSFCGLRPLHLARGNVMALGWCQLLWSDQPSPSFQPCCCPTRSARLILGAACSLLGWVWGTVSTPKAILNRPLPLLQHQNAQITSKFEEWWEVKVRRFPGATCHREKWERCCSGIWAKDALSYQENSFGRLHHSYVLMVA